MSVDLLSDAAESMAQALLVEKFQEEFDRIHKELCVVRGLDLVTVYRTVYRQVSPIDAITLIRHGWKRLDEDSL